MPSLLRASVRQTSVDETDAPFCGLAEAAAHSNAVTPCSLVSVNVVGALASLRAIAFLPELVTSCSDPAVTDLAGPDTTRGEVGGDFRTVGGAEVAVTYRSYAPF